MPNIIIKLAVTLLAMVAAVGLMFVDKGFNTKSRFQTFLWSQVHPVQKKFFTGEDGYVRKGTKYFFWAVLSVFLALMWFATWI
jgi:hypothetical protein